MTSPTDATLRALQAVLDAIGPAAVAVSGGVDSMTLAVVAHRRLNGATRMFHAVSPAVPGQATARVRDYAAREGWRLQVIDAGEFDDPSYRKNPANRCFYCKTNLYGTVAARTEATVLSGTNIDDLGDYRPGLEAARAHRVRHPFVEANIDKAAVRAMAARLGLDDLAELPAAPCLSSRIETGIRIEADMLALVNDIELLVREALAPDTVRCRVRRGGIVIELDAACLDRLDAAARDGLRATIDAMARRAGLERPVAFAPYRMGSAFLRPADESAPSEAAPA